MKWDSRKAGTLPRLNSNPPTDWVSFLCPFCDVRLRIRAAYAHLRGRCPECGTRIEAPRPRPEAAPAPHATDSNEPLGLLPIEDEWPEPAQLEEMETSAAYGVALAPGPAAQLSPRADLDGEAYELRDRPTPQPNAPFTVEPVEAYDAMPPEGPAERPEGAVPDYLRGLELEPPKVPSWTDRSALDLFIFPFRQGSRLVCFYLTFDFTILAGLLALVVAFPPTGPFVVPLGAMLSLWIGLYAASCFFAIVEETAAGTDSIGYPRGAGLIDGWSKLVYLIWLFMCAAIPIGATWRIGRDVLWVTDLWWMTAVGILIVLFPIVCLSSMAASSRWLILDRGMIGSMLRRPYVLALTWILSAGLAIVCGFWLFLLLLRTEWWQPPFAGFTFAAAFLIYARILGRAGWRLSRPFVRRRIRPKPERLAVAEVDSWGPDPDWDDMPPAVNMD